jgi:hypothetical protein
VALVGVTSTSLSAMSIGETKSPPALLPVENRDSMKLDFRSRPKLRWALGGLAGVGLVMGLFFAASGEREQSSQVVAAQAPPPIGSAIVPPVVPAATTLAAPIADAGTSRDARPEKPSDRRRGKLTPAAKPKATTEAPGPASSELASERAPAGPAKAAPVRKRKTKDSWDPSTFGGRL